MPAAHRLPRTDAPADASPPANAPTDATASSARSADGPSQPGRLLETELECARLRARVLELEAALDARERERQDMIDRYEHLLSERDRPTPVRRQSFGAGLLERFRRALASHTR